MEATSNVAPQEASLAAVAGVVGAAVGVALLGAAVDALLRRRAGGGKRALGGLRLWSALLLLASYSCLIPGLFSNLFEARVALSMFGITKSLTSLSESMVALVGSMAENHMIAGASLVTVYAMVIPASKLVLMLVSSLLQLRGGASSMLWARRCVVVLRFISKWACPDMFAYILMTYLFRSLNKPPTVLSEMHLGLGFSCFCVFCVGSTVSSLGIRLPEVPQEEHAAHVASPRPAAAPGRAGALLRRLAERAAPLVAPAVLLLGAAFVALLGFGLTVPCMELRLEMSLLYQRNPQLKTWSFILDSLDLPELLHSEVSIWRCMVSLAGWFAGGDASAAVALTMYAVFVVLLPVAHVCLLALASFSPVARAQKVLAVAGAVSKLCMLDVSIMGACVVVFALANLRASGVVISLCPGLLPLLAAELCRYAAAALACPRSCPLARSSLSVAASSTVEGKDQSQGQDLEEGPKEKDLEAGSAHEQESEVGSEASTCAVDSEPSLE